MKAHITLPNDRLMCGGEPSLSDATEQGLCQKCHRRAIAYAENFGLKPPMGALVMLYADFPRPGDAHLALVLCAFVEERDDEPCTKWVTWQYNKQTKSFFLGHYFAYEDEARQDWAQRLAKVVS